MFGRFFGGSGDDKAELADEGWPAARILAALKGHYGSVEQLGEDGPLKVLGVQDNGVNFVVALMQSAPRSGRVVEIGFLARFVGFPVNAQKVEALNRNLHISVAALEGADMFLMAGVQVTGPYDDGQFMLLLESWRRDLAMTLGNLSSDELSYAAAFPAAKIEAARAFAVNEAPAPAADGAPADVLARFMGAKMSAAKAFCDACDGRGKRGLIARTCADCAGTGFV